MLRSRPRVVAVGVTGWEWLVVGRRCRQWWLRLETTTYHTTGAIYTTRTLQNKFVLKAAEMLTHPEMFLTHRDMDMAEFYNPLTIPVIDIVTRALLIDCY